MFINCCRILLNDATIYSHTHTSGAIVAIFNWNIQWLVVITLSSYVIVIGNPAWIVNFVTPYWLKPDSWIGREDGSTNESTLCIYTYTNIHLHTLIDKSMFCNKNCWNCILYILYYILIWKLSNKLMNRCTF